MTPEDALRVAEEVNRQGIAVTLDSLGQSVTSESAAIWLPMFTTLLDSIATRGMQANISVKLTQMGLEESADLAELSPGISSNTPRPRETSCASTWKIHACTSYSRHRAPHSCMPRYPRRGRRSHSGLSLSFPGRRGAVALLAQATPGITANLGELYIRAGQPQQALDLALAEKPPASNSVEIDSLKAAAYLALGQKKEARDAYTDLLKQDANVLGARRQLVALLIEAGDFESARAVVTAGIAIAPTNYQLYQDLAMIDLKSTGVEAALATADRLMSQDRDFADLRALKGDLYLAANRPGDAVDAYQKEFQANPSSLLVTRLAGAEMRAGRVDDAINLLIDWVGKHEDDFVVERQLSEVMLGAQRYPEAAHYLEALLKQKPYDAIALNNLAWIYQQQGDARAAATARRAYVLSPNAQTADTLGWILVTTGDASNGVALLRQAEIEASGDPRVVYHYAVALKDTGDKNEAIKQLTVVVGMKGPEKEKADAQKLLTDLKGS